MHMRGSSVKQPPHPPPPQQRPSQFHLVAAAPVRVSTHPQITFRAIVKDMKPNETLYVVGGAEELGAWKEERAKDMQPDRERRTWSVSLALKPHETVDYKYIRVSEEHGQVVAARWEDGPNSQNRQFYWNGSSTVEDAGEISSFGAVQPLKQTYYGKETVQAHPSGQDGANSDDETGESNDGEANSVKVNQPYFGKGGEDVPRYEWVCKMFEKMNCAMQSLRDRVERDLEWPISELSHKQDERDKNFNLQKRILGELERRIEHVQEKCDKIEVNLKTSARSQEDSADKLSQMIEECLKDCSLSRKLKDLEDGLASLQRKTQSTAKLITPLDRKFEELESVVASQKTLLASQSKSLEVMQREINDLQIHIPRKPAPQKIESSQSLERLQNLESQVTSLGQALQRMSEKETQPPLVEPHAAKVEMPQPAAPATSINNGALNEWNEVSWKPAAEASSSDAASRRRSSSMPKYTAPKPKRGFEFQRPLKPTDTSMRDVCLEVERQLCEAMFGEAPVDVRKKVLKTVQLRCHPDKLGDRSGKDVEALNWLEDWKSTHIKLYFQPHDVPEEYQKYLPKPGSGKDLVGGCVPASFPGRETSAAGSP